jgi:hypothetical protein
MLPFFPETRGVFKFLKHCTFLSRERKDTKRNRKRSPLDPMMGKFNISSKMAHFCLKFMKNGLFLRVF